MPLNALIVVVFSEPVAGSSLTATSVQLTHGSTPVAGTVGLLGGTATAAVFTPSALLDANTDYRLVVTQAVKDLTGDALAAGDTVEFTTGTNTVGPVWSVSVVPDTTALRIGAKVQLVATAHDSLGGSVAGRPVLWSSDNPAAGTVSATGLVTALAQGETRVHAQVEGADGVAVVQVSGTLAPVDSVEVTPESAAVVTDGFVQLTAVLRDAAGNILQYRSVNWETSAPGVAGGRAGQGPRPAMIGHAGRSPVRLAVALAESLRAEHSACRRPSYEGCGGPIVRPPKREEPCHDVSGC